MIKELTGEEAAWPQDKVDSASVEELKELRIGALRRLGRAEKERDEARQLGDVYASAARQLTERAEKVEAEAAEAREKGDGEAAKDLSRASIEMRQLVEQNQKIADERIARMKFDGYRGSFTSFLLPRVQHGDAVKLTNPTIPEREGVYLVKQVITTYGVNGGRQEIFLDAKIA